MEVYTPEEVAAILKVSVRTVYTLLKEGKLRGRKIGSGKPGRWRVLDEDLKAFVRGEDSEDRTEQE